jgi:hypothetical protein
MIRNDPPAWIAERDQEHRMKEPSTDDTGWLVASVLSHSARAQCVLKSARNRGAALPAFPGIALGGLLRQVPLVGTLHDNQLAMTASWTRGGADTPKSAAG